MYIEDQRRFLEDIAIQYKFYGDTHTAFLGRFIPENVDKQNIQLRLTWTKADNKEQKIQEELQKICNVLQENGCDIPEPKQGRSKKGESPWELAYSWLWQVKFPEWQKSQVAIGQPPENPGAKDQGLDWREICGQMLAEQKQLTTNAFTNADGVNLQREEIYVPLAIVERKPPKPQPRNPQEEKEEEKLIPIAEESFFEEVLRSGQSSSQGRRIAVIGDPGSGKTTRLQKIADWILEQGLGLPLWVSLADLTQPTIAQYIEEFWLKQTGVSLTIEALTQQKDQIWLLLDGVDEMTSRVETRHVSALVGGWLQAVRVVVTCRVNVWEADKNAFSGFDVFRNLEFSPEQVRDYIRCWFAGAGDAATGEDLATALTQSENYRLKELIQNPLRLWMLCHIWYRNRGGLPETQAELYGQFVDRVYDWKADEEIWDQREAIDAALAKLALAAMEQQDEVSRFRLQESWVVKKLGSRQIFKAIEKLGWLNRVERSPEAICVFYHATFQEYFAALGVEDWGDFLPNDHSNFPVEGKKYRIFEPQWKQVILLWLGREDVADAEKEEFINKLVSFDTGCYENGNFYYYRAFFLAAEGITQYADFTPIGKIANVQEYSLVDAVINQLIQWTLGGFDSNKQKWTSCLGSIKEFAKAALKKTKRTKVVEYLSQNISMMLYSNEIIAELESEESQLFVEQLNTYIRWLNNFSGKEELIFQFVQTLSEIDPNNEIAISALIIFLENTDDEIIRSQASDSLSKIDKENHQAITALIRILEDPESQYIHRQAAGILGKIDQGNLQAISVLINILENPESQYIHRRVADSLSEIDQGNPQAIAALINILENPKNEDICWQTADSLGKIAQGNPLAITALIKILENPENKDIHWEAAKGLGEVAQGNPQAITSLIRILENPENKDIHWWAVWGLGKIAQGNPQAITSLINILKTTDNEDIRYLAVWSLDEIDQRNPQAIAALIKILENPENKNNHLRAADSLGKIDQGNPQAIAALIRILKTTENRYIHLRAADSLGKIDRGNPQAIAALIRLLKATEDEDTRWQTAKSLQKILATSEQYINAISALKDCLSDEVYQNNFDRFNYCYQVLWHCAANLPYPDFHDAWHSPPE